MVKQGDIILVDFSPTIGSEQRGRRPAVVVSNNDFQRVTKKFAIVVPITSTRRNKYPLHVGLDNRTNTQGDIMCEQIKMIDTEARNVQVIESIPNDILEKILNLVTLFF